MAVLPSAARDTEPPANAPVSASEPTSLGPCWAQTPLLRLQIHATLLLPLTPPTMAVLPSAERDTEEPWWLFPSASEATSLGPCWLQTPPLRAQIAADPADPISTLELLSPGAPTMAVLPSADRDTEEPW
jgi:hypothetical protein